MEGAAILVVDDEPRVRQVLRDILEDDGYTVVAVENGMAALQEVEHRNFDVAVIDYVLPSPCTGIALIRRLRWQSPEVVPILITGYPSAELEQLASKEEVFRYITKPLDKDFLCSTVARALWIKALRGIKESNEGAGTA